MRMLSTSVQMQFLNLSTAQFSLRQHTTNGNLQNPLRLTSQQVTWGSFTLAAGVTGMAQVNLIGQLGTGEPDLVGIDNHHVVTIIKMRGEVGLVFSTQDGRNLGGQPTHNFTFRVNHVPLTLYRSRVGGLCLVA